MACAPSKNTGSSSNSSACKRRRGALPAGASDQGIRRIEKHELRIRNGALQERVQAAAVTIRPLALFPFGPISHFHQRGRHGRADALPANRRIEQPARLSMASRINSAGKRKRDWPSPAAGSPGSRVIRSSGRLCDDCWYVDDMTISLMRCFTSQPDSTNSAASQSSSSGCEGGVSASAEVFRSGHHAPAEEFLPDPIHRHARRQRIVRRDQPPRQRQAVVFDAGREAGQDSRRIRLQLQCRGCENRRAHGGMCLRGIRPFPRWPGFRSTADTSHPALRTSESRRRT